MYQQMTSGLNKITSNGVKKLLFIAVLTLGISAGLSVLAHGATEEEITKGKAIMEKLEKKELSCQNLSDEDFEATGEYFMAKMMGETHTAMNEMMENMMGEEGEKNAHIAMGKRMSGCDPTSPMPQEMMNMMGFGKTGYGMMNGGMMNWGSGWKNNSMMGNFFGGYWFGWIYQILFLTLIILSIAALIKWLSNQNKK